MAIGDKPNQNLFGTNYNPEDEEEKKARLAAQNAMMGAGSPTVVGAGNIPAAAFGQAPTVAPFSIEAAGQVNPMMQPQSLEVPLQAPVTFLPYADDVAPPPASALSVFTPGGKVKPNVDVNAITPSPEMTSPSSVNTALNQEVAVGSPSQEPGYFQRVGEFAKSALNRDQGLFDVDRLSTAADDLLGSAMRNLTPAEDRKFANNEPFGKTFTDTFAITRPDGTKFYPDEVTSSAGATQAPSEASALGATQGVTSTAETPSGSAQGQVGAVQSPFLQSPDTPSGLGGPLLDGFNRVNDSFRAPNAPMGQDATRAALGGMTLNQYLNAPAGTEGVSGLQTDPQGRMITPSARPPVDSAVPPATAQPPVDALSSFEQDSLSRQQRIGGTGSYEGDSEAREARVRANERQPGESQADRDTRIAQSRTTGGQTEGLSFDDARRRAEGQLAARGVKNPSASQVNALARGIQAGEPERLAELETKRAVNEARLKTAQATLDRPEFEGKVYTINGVTFAQTSNGGAQVISTGTETPEEATAKMKDYAFALEQIDKARKAYQAGDIDKANDIFTAAEIQKDGFATNATEYFGGLTQQQEANITRQAFDTMEEAEAANLPEGTKITIGGRNATV